MKKQTMIIVIVAVALVTLATVSIALAQNLAFDKITGGTHAMIEEWGNTELWNTYLLQVNPWNQVLKGRFTVRITNPYEQGARSYSSTPVCVNFSTEADGKPSAIVVHRITADGVSGWGPGEPFEYAKWKIIDGQQPDGEGDTLFLAYECRDPNFENTCDTDGDGVGDAPYDEFWPADEPAPACDESNFTDFPLQFDGGNIVIH
jgi:hypothetical protein